MPGFSYLWQRSREKAILWVMDFEEVAKIQGQKKCDKLSIRKKGYKEIITYMSKILIWSWCWLILFLQYAKLGVYQSMDFILLESMDLQMYNSGEREQRHIFLSTKNLKDSKKSFLLFFFYFDPNI